LFLLRCKIYTKHKTEVHVFFIIYLHLSIVIRLMWASLAGGWFHRASTVKGRGFFYAQFFAL